MSALGGRKRSHGRHLPPAVALLLAASLSTALALPAGAATVSGAWLAKIGSAGVNGTATVQAYTNGAGSMLLKLAKLKPSTSYPVTLFAGTCSAVGKKLFSVAAIRTTAKGSASRTSALAASQITAIKGASGGRIAIRIGTGSSSRCGKFAAQSIPPYVAATITVDVYPFDVVATPGGVWVINGASNTASRIDPATNQVLSAVTLGNPGTGTPEAVAFNDGVLWVASSAWDLTKGAAIPGKLIRVDPASGEVAASIPIGRNNTDVVTSPGAVWVVNSDDGTVTRVDPATNQAVATVQLAAGLSGIAYGEGSVWVSNELTGKVARIDAATNQVVATVATVGAPEGLVDAAGAIWVANLGHSGLGDGVLSQIDPTTNQVIGTVPVGAGPLFVSFCGGYLWVSLQGDTNVVQVNPTTRAVKARVGVGAPSWGIDASDRAVWVVHPVAAGAEAKDRHPGTVTRISF